MSDQLSGLALIAARLAASACETQSALDEGFNRDARTFARLVETAGLPLDHSLVTSIAPCRMVLREQSIDVAITLTRETSIEGQVALRLGGRIVHSFFDARYSKRTTRHDRITLHVTASPGATEPTTVP